VLVKTALFLLNAAFAMAILLYAAQTLQLNSARNTNYVYYGASDWKKRNV
jgi:hypothetical protein